MTAIRCPLEKGGKDDVAAKRDYRYLSRCGHIYEDWYRPSINLSLDDFDDDYLERGDDDDVPGVRGEV